MIEQPAGEGSTVVDTLAPEHDGFGADTREKEKSISLGLAIR